ncbi:aspartate--tRNA ligase [Patescibacteria group bacterium]|nr:aspartate--tRNA ligase [Patescibacteria group bacterium]
MQRVLNIETVKYINKTVKVCGWVNSIRSHGKIIFFDLRDRSGLVQIVFSPNPKLKVKNEKHAPYRTEGSGAGLKVYDLARTLRPEWVIEVIGTVKERPKGMINPKIGTGKVELQAENLKVFSEAKTLPFPIDTPGYEIREEIRLKYRYLDLRRERLLKNLEKRQLVIQFMRTFLQNEGFLEVETPILTKSTPEGARDYLVPSRLYPGKFYALPQSPQQYKQLLMVAGLEKYFQIARCLRDEDPRADRQPEHTQLDIEMSFVEKEALLDLIEGLYIALVKKLFPEKKITEIPFPKMMYKEAMKKYKTDKPDLRKDKKDQNELAFCFITDFPMFEWHSEPASAKATAGKWGAMHHPFTKPQTENSEEIKKNPEEILAEQYDFALNGNEIGGGSIRNTNPEVLIAVFEILGHKKDEIKKNFSHYFEAFSYGIPPHGGIALGIDRFLATILNEPNIREVIAFPKTGDSRDLMMGIPADVSKEQLKELHIKLSKN